MIGQWLDHEKIIAICVTYLESASCGLAACTDPAKTLETKPLIHKILWTKDLVRPAIGKCPEIKEFGRKTLRLR